MCGNGSGYGQAGGLASPGGGGVSCGGGGGSVPAAVVVVEVEGELATSTPSCLSLSSRYIYIHKEI